MSKEISPQIFNTLCKNCGERSSCKGMCIELNNILIKRREWIQIYTVQAVFVQSGMAMVKTRDCDDGFDAYVDEIKGVINE